MIASARCPFFPEIVSGGCHARSYPILLKRGCEPHCRVAIVPLAASERQSEWFLKCSPMGKSEGYGRRVFSLTGLSSQYSAGNRTVVTLRSASVMIQILVPLLSV
jgi:hypothetical protein